MNGVEEDRRMAGKAREDKNKTGKPEKKNR